jgi:hypothetical protein
LGRSFADPEVAAVFAGHAPAMRRRLLHLRELIFAAAAELAGVGGLVETLKWGQPAYLTKTGSTIRIDAFRGRDERYAMFFHCQSKLVESFSVLYPQSFAFEGNRALLFGLRDKIPEAELRHCISMALTYHARQPRGANRSRAASLRAGKPL